MSCGWVVNRMYGYHYPFCNRMQTEPRTKIQLYIHFFIQKMIYLFSPKIYPSKWTIIFQRIG